jgi:hypothetical protein
MITAKPANSRLGGRSAHTIFSIFFDRALLLLRLELLVLQTSMLKTKSEEYLYKHIKGGT